MGYFVTAAVKGQHIYVKFYLEFKKTALKAEDTEPAFAVLNLKSNSSLSSGNLHPHHSRRGEASQFEFQEHMNVFWLSEHCSSGEFVPLGQ